MLVSASIPAHAALTPVSASTLPMTTEMNPFAVVSKQATVSRLIGEAEFSAVYAAADFSAEVGIFLDTNVTIAWSLLGVSGDLEVQQAFSSFLKCMGDWMRQRVNPIAFIYAHECGFRVGLHTHIAVSVVGADYRREFRRWAADWVNRFVGRPATRALRVTGPMVESEWMHWLRFGYLMKGYDRGCVVQSSRTSPDGNTVYLGDIIPFEWRDPGPVTLKNRVGVSRSLGPERRAIGAPYDDMVERVTSVEIDQDFRIVQAPARTIKGRSFRSRYDDGVRSVSHLYGRDLYERVTKMHARETAPLVDDLDWIDGLVI